MSTSTSADCRCASRVEDRLNLVEPLLRSRRCLVVADAAAELLEQFSSFVNLPLHRRQSRRRCRCEDPLLDLLIRSTATGPCTASADVVSVAGVGDVVATVVPGWKPGLPRGSSRSSDSERSNQRHRRDFLSSTNRFKPADTRRHFWYASFRIKAGSFHRTCDEPDYGVEMPKHRTGNFPADERPQRNLLDHLFQVRPQRQQ